MKLLLFFVVFHPSDDEVSALIGCLQQLSDDIGYSILINDHKPGEPAERLELGSSLNLRFSENLGYGRAVNRGVHALSSLNASPQWIGAFNTDLLWSSGTMETILTWLDTNPNVVLAVPQITDVSGVPQKLRKRDPTVLALFSRRFWADSLKPGCLRRYDDWYLMSDYDQNTIHEVPYLSGCCMIIQHKAFVYIGGFDEKFFLYLEDADLTRKLRAIGRCVHLPIATVQHGWGRGSHRSLRLTLTTIHSAWIYFRKWGLALW